MQKRERETIPKATAAFSTHFKPKKPPQTAQKHQKFKNRDQGVPSRRPIAASRRHFAIGSHLEGAGTGPGGGCQARRRGLASLLQAQCIHNARRYAERNQAFQ